ncbi:MAG: ABC transporter ATP-binding protein [Firmicutes bacterium]|nr:ABC transporter ATP-binding protein [Bacillota bacterium]
MLKVQNLTKVYSSGKRAVDDVNLTVEAGDIYAFIGPNGAGKTSTIKCIVGIHGFDSGEITIDGNSVKENSRRCKEITAFIPDNPDVYTSITGMQYLNFIASITKLNPTRKAELVEKYAKVWELDHALGMPIGSYSHGMRQKLVLISAFMREPKLLVLDEPFVGLDPKAAFTMKEVMKEFVANGGAIFYSTHVLDIAEKLCNKVAIIKGGKIIADGTMAEIAKDKSLEKVFLDLE